MKYIIEYQGDLYGPFDTDLEASDYARNNLKPNWRLRTIHIVPKKGTI